MNLWKSAVVLAFLSLAVGTAHASAVYTSTGPYQCPNLTVKLTNNTPATIAGGIWGASGNLGSSGYFAKPWQTQDVGVYAQSYPGGDFKLVGNFQWVNNQYVYINCAGTVPAAANACPNPAVHPHMYIGAGYFGNTYNCIIQNQ